MPDSQKSDDLSAPYSALTARWREAFVRPPPKNLSRRLITHAIAYAEQARFYGGLSLQIRKQLRALASETQTSAPKNLNVGTRLIREWNGNSYVVDVTDNGFTMDRRTFKSLSAVAKAITGAHWSGRAFFGITRRKK